MGMLHYRATVTDGTATAMTLFPTSSGPNAPSTKPAVGGRMFSVSCLSSSDTSISFNIADGTGNCVVAASADYTTRTNFKSDAATIARDAITGALTLTAAGISGGNLIVDAWVLV